MSAWSVHDIPPLTGKIALVTGGNIGLGFKSSMELARAGAEVVVACRSLEKGSHAIALLRNEVPDAALHTLQLDLTDLYSVENCANEFLARFDRLDILMNNAGVVNLAQLCRTADGHEMHMATNHYGHFALTGRLFDLIARTPCARVVTLSSLSYKQGSIMLDDLDWTKREYDRVKAYGDSKLANLMFTQVLQERLLKQATSAIAVSAHPGLTGTERQQSIGIGGALARWVASSVSQGVLPQLRAACDPSIKPSEFVGPRFGLRGAPSIVANPLNQENQAMAERLWSKSEMITGVRVPPKKAGN